LKPPTLGEEILHISGQVFAICPQASKRAIFTVLLKPTFQLIEVPGRIFSSASYLLEHDLGGVFELVQQ